MSQCKSFSDLDRQARWLADLDRIIEEMELADQQVNADHLTCVAADLEFQQTEFLKTADAEVTRRG